MKLHVVLALSQVVAPQGIDQVAENVLDEFSTHRVVAIGENHGHREFHDLVTTLLRRPRAIELIDDVAVEWGNSLYQDVVDRYVAGLSVPWDSVTMAWRNSVVSPSTVWDAPVYERFFREMREINAALPSENRYRVLLADSPVDWSEIETRDQLGRYFDRAQAMSEVIRRESLLNGRRSLFLAGGLHVSRLPRVRMNRLGIPVSEITPVAWLELRHPGVTYVVQSMARMAELDLDDPRDDRTSLDLIEINHSGLGAAPANRATTLKNRDGSRSDVYGDATLSDIVDAVILWADHQLTFEEPDRSIYQIEWYWAALNRRSMLLRGQPMDPSIRGD